MLCTKVVLHISWILGISYVLTGAKVTTHRSRFKPTPLDPPAKSSATEPKTPLWLQSTAAKIQPTNTSINDRETTNRVGTTNTKADNTSAKDQKTTDRVGKMNLMADNTSDNDQERTDRVGITNLPPANTSDNDQKTTDRVGTTNLPVSGTSSNDRKTTDQVETTANNSFGNKTNGRVGTTQPMVANTSEKDQDTTNRVEIMNPSKPAGTSENHRKESGGVGTTNPPPSNSSSNDRNTNGQAGTTNSQGSGPRIPSIRPALYEERHVNSKMHFDPESWCSSQVDCGNMHVMCQYPTPGPGENCEGYMEIPMTERDVFMMLHYFNYRRNLVAGGQEYRLPRAADMRMLEWDDTLAIFAQRWADQCIYDPYIIRDDTLLGTLTDTCRNLPEFEVAQVSARIHGFNVTGAKVENLLALLINTISSNFFNVTAHVVYSGYIPEDDYGAIALHSQAYLIGCGVASYLLDLRTNAHRMSVIYCNLGPLKNMYMLDRYYKQGEPCSDCPSGTSCQPDSYFQFLCQKDGSLDNPDEIRYRRYYNSEGDLKPSSYFLHEMVTAMIFLTM